MLDSSKWQLPKIKSLQWYEGFFSVVVIGFFSVVEIPCKNEKINERNYYLTQKITALHTSRVYHTIKLQQHHVR